MSLLTNLYTRYLGRQVPIAPLVTFRIAFGLLMLLSTLRFWWRGWIDTVYVRPRFHFTYLGFEWVRPLGASGMHLVFGLIALAALFIMLGLLYRVSTIVFFILFTYVELIDLTTYLNHYYFVSLVAFLLIWLPANRSYSFDRYLRLVNRASTVPSWTIDILKFQMGIVYVFAGIAKLNADWLIDALPLRIWLPAKSHLPIVGPVMHEAWIAYLFSWFGAVYDLFIVFFLLHHRTRLIAYFFVLVFHIATAVFFPGIGVFPYVMIVCSTIFFPPHIHELVLRKLPGYLGSLVGYPRAFQYRVSELFASLILIFVAVQLLVPNRCLLYPDKLFWNEEGYRFSWRVMLMEKSGAAFFKVRDAGTAKTYEVNNAAWLTPMQEKMMCTQPDMLLQFAHFLAKEYRRKGISNPQVYAEVYVALNGARSRLFIDSTVNLAAQSAGLRHHKWILPYQTNNN